MPLVFSVGDDYDERKFEDLREYWLATLSLVPIFVLVGWSWDWVVDAANAPRTIAPRIAIATLIVIVVFAIYRRWVPRKACELLVYGAIVASVPLWLNDVLARLAGGMETGLGPHMFYVLGTLVVAVPMRFKANVIGMLAVLLAPNVCAALGWAPGFPTLRYNVLLFPTGAFALFALWSVELLYRRTYDYQLRIEQAAREDALTGLPNRRQFNEIAEQLFASYRRYKRPASVLLMDIDRFKSVNDQYGHAGGDAVLAHFAKLLDGKRRESDVVARIGGEEFALLLPETDIEGAAAAAEHVRRAVAESRVELPGEQPFEVTVSIGAAGFSEGDTSFTHVIRRADLALYAAKSEGRNRAVIAPQDAEAAPPA